MNPTAVPHRLPIPTGFPVGPVNVYLFTEPEPVLVDTGLRSEESLAALRSGLAEYGLTLSDLARVIISHPHIDHFGLAGAIAARSRATIHILEMSLPWLTDYPTLWQERVVYYRDHLFPRLGLPPDIRDPILAYYTEIESRCDSVPPERVVPFRAEDRLSMGGAAWRVLHTPGHTNTLTCFHQPQTRQFLSTDMLLPIAPTPIPDPPPAGQTERIPSLPQFLQSLRRVEQLEVDIVYPGHGEPFTDHRKVIRQQRERIAMRKAECLRLIRGGLHTVDGLLLKMYAHYSPQFRFTGLWMILGYLDLLIAEGKVVQRTVKGVWHYEATA